MINFVVKCCVATIVVAMTLAVLVLAVPAAIVGFLAML